MSYGEAVLIAEARRTGRAQRSALLRHRKITKKPLGLVLWQLGAEPFTAAAVAWGFSAASRSVVAPGEPRNRELAFRELTKVARAFNAWFEGTERDEPTQVVVPNRGNLTLLGRLGRRLAYLPTDGEHPADPDLVRFGKHLRFLADAARYPGQQLVLVLTDLLSSHWVSELSPLEAQSLPALDGAIDPPRGMSAHEAAFAAETTEIGPLPSGEDDDVVDQLLTAFNLARARSTDEAVVAPLRRPLEAHYARLVDRGWPLLWKCLARERTFREARSVERRWKEDVAQLDRHIAWVVTTGGRQRTRQSSAQAAYTLRHWEEAQALLVAEEATDDRLRMLPYFLANQAVMGKVTAVNLEHYDEGTGRRVRRPLIRLETEEPCLIPVGKALYWAKEPGGREYLVDSVKQLKRRWQLVLRHQTGADSARPQVGSDAIFSIHTTRTNGYLKLPKTPPWTHTPKAEVETSSIEGPGEVWE